MNHLAHLVLAGNDNGLRLGAFLGDHIKGKLALQALPDSWSRGVVLHRRIDGLCDGHGAVREFIADLEPPWRRYGGIVLDVLFDCMLTRHWHRFGPGDLEAFAVDVDQLLAHHYSRLPARLQRFSFWARERQLWSSYGDPEVLAEIFQRLAWRHGRPSPLASGLDLLGQHEDRIELLFLRLFPDVVEQTRSWREG